MTIRFVVFAIVSVVLPSVILATPVSTYGETDAVSGVSGAVSPIGRVETVPEPAALLLVGGGLVVMGMIRRRRS